MNPNCIWHDPRGPPPQYTVHNHFLASVHIWQAYQHPQVLPPFLPQAWFLWWPYPAQYCYSQLGIRHNILSEFNYPVHRAQYTYLQLDAGQYTVPEHHSPESQVHFISGASSSNSSPPYRHVPARGPFHHEISPHEDTNGEEPKSTLGFSQWSSTHVQPHDQISRYNPCLFSFILMTLSKRPPQQAHSSRDPGLQSVEGSPPLPAHRLHCSQYQWKSTSVVFASFGPTPASRSA